MLQKHLSIHTVYQEYAELVRYTHHDNPIKAERILNELQSGFLRGPLMTWGLQRTTPGRKMSQADVQAAFELMSNLSVQRLLKARAAMEKAFVQQAVSEASRKIYGNRVEQFLEWAEQQMWWPSEKNLRLQGQCCPPQKREGGRYSDLPLTHRRGMYLNYQLKDSDINPRLRAELAALHQCLTEAQFSGRFTAALKSKTADFYIKDLRLVLGYLNREQDIPLEALSLQLLIPVITREQLRGLDEDARQELWQGAKDHINSWLLPYFQFSREKVFSISPRTRHSKLCIYLAATKGLYLLLSNGVEPHPILDLLANYRRQANKEVQTWIRTKRRVSNLEHKWPDPVPGKTALVILQEEVVEKLRLETRPRYAKGHFRKAPVIARDLLHFIKWALMVYIPARRQEDHRSLKVALSCPLQRPDDVPPDGLWFPKLPDEERDRNDDGKVADNFIYRTYTFKGQPFPDGVWVLEIGDYKTEDTYGNFSIKLPNLEYDDGTCFYDYLEHYFCGQCLPVTQNNVGLYDWWDPAMQGRRHRWVTQGRSEFNPYDVCNVPLRRKSAPLWCWGYAFVVPTLGIQADGGSYAGSFERSSYRFLGKRITPHMVRSMWATWAYQMGLSDVQLRSLAYAMGHSVDTLRAMYERVSPDERLRPIEEVLNLFWFNSLEIDEEPQQVSNSKLQQILQVVKHLAPVERQMLLQILQDAS